MRRPSAEIDDVEGGGDAEMVVGIAIHLLVNGSSSEEGVSANGAEGTGRNGIRLAHELQISEEHKGIFESYGDALLVGYWFGVAIVVV